jgi:predicted AAA+ superfamily ATPase
LSADLGLLRQKVEALPKGSRVVIDEIQKLPELLDEVHALIFDYEEDYQFALTGSSARKLKKTHANLLAGRAVTREMFGLTARELNYDFQIDSMLKFGTLPKIHNLPTEEEKKDYLYSYVNTYLKEEIQQESAVRNLNSYHRYLKHAAIMNSQIMNANNLSRDAAVARSTIDGYFSIVEETLLGFFIPAVQFRAKIKEVANPKFYFFDCGVIRALQNSLDEMDSIQRGHLLETYIVGEVRAHISYSGVRGELGYWATHGGNEVDLIWQKGKKSIGIEIKSSSTWKRGFSDGLKTLSEAKKIQKGYGVYLGKDALMDEEIPVLPLMEFLRKLHAGEILA